MEEKPIKIILSDRAKGFLMLLPEKARKKILYNIFKVESGVMDKELFKKLEDSDIWELRTLYDGVAYRFFAFWDTDINTLVIVTHGIVKKTQKTPQKEIERAKEVMRIYFEAKKNN